MPNINDIFQSKFLKLAALKGTSPIVTIARIGFEPVGKSREMCPVAYFVGKTKGMILNRTNARAVAAIAGSNITEDWIGVRVQLVAARATFGTETHDVIRIQAPVVAPAGRVA